MKIIIEFSPEEIRPANLFSRAVQNLTEICPHLPSGNRFDSFGRVRVKQNKFNRIIVIIRKHVFDS